MTLYNNISYKHNYRAFINKRCFEIQRIHIVIDCFLHPHIQKDTYILENEIENIICEMSC